MRVTQALIYKDNLKHNFNLIKNQLKANTLICAVVKGNAYGHGIEVVAPLLDQLGANCFAIACLNGATRLRNLAITKPIYLLRPCLPHEIAEAIKLELSPFISSFHEATLWQQQAKEASKLIKVHLKVNTSMTRLGCDSSDFIPLANFINEQSHLKLEGVATHFANADSEINPSLEEDIRQFTALVSQLKRPDLLIHCAGSATIQRLPAGQLFNMVRPGLALYGYPPSDYSQQHSLLADKLKPVMELRSHVIFIRKLQKDSPVSYGSQYLAKAGNYIATIPLGYADGYNISFSNLKNAVLIKGRRYNIAGRVCMDQLMVDLGPNPDNIGLYDEVTFFGPNPPALTATELTGSCRQGSAYTLLSAIAERVERRLI